MSVILGQNNIVSKIDTYSIETFPRTVLLNGPFGSGKHLLCNYIAQKLGLSCYDITDKVNIDTLSDISLLTNPMIYTLDLAKLSVKEQNMILKFIEEPPKSAYIILFSERLNNVIETVKNRCLVMQLATYKKEDLKQFAEKLDVKNEDVINISNTPGEILFFNELSFQLPEIREYCNRIFEKMHAATPSNVLAISDKISYKSTDNKFNPKCFFRILKEVSYQWAIKSTEPKFSQAYVMTKEFTEHLEVPHVNIQYLFENYLMALKQLLT